jgi:hypothetical protein
MEKIKQNNNKMMVMMQNNKDLDPFFGFVKK